MAGGALVLLSVFRDLSQWTGGTFGILGIKPEVALCKASTLPSIMPLWLQIFSFKTIFSIIAVSEDG